MKSHVTLLKLNKYIPAIIFLTGKGKQLEYMVRKQVNVVTSVSEKKKAIVRSVLEFYSLFCDAVVLK